MAESGDNSPLVDGNLLVAKALVCAGIDRMFGVVGILVTSIANRVVTIGIRFIAFHNEQSEGYANAWQMVMISGSCDQKDFGRRDSQELDPIAAVKPFVKFFVKAKNINQIPSSVFSVLDHAGSGRPGGCYLDIPSDVLHQTVTDSEAKQIAR